MVMADIGQQIREAAIARGIDPEVALKIANAESDLVSSAKNPRSSARGLFQVTDDTWKFYGGDPKKRNDVAENIRVGLNVIDGNRAEYKRRFGREPSQSELYTMHVFGKTGGPMVLSSDPNTELKELLSPKVLKANPQFKSMTVAELSESMRKKMKEPAAAAPKAPVTAGPAVAPAAPKETMKPQAPVKQVAEESAPKRPEMSRDFLASMGPSYMAALAASTLGDLSEDREEGETDEDYIERITQERLAAQEEPAVAPPRRLLQAELSYQSPFETEEPVKLAFGGLPYKPSAMLPSAVKTQVATAQQQWDAYNKAAADYNRRVDEYNNLLNQYNSAFVQYGDQPVTYYAAGRGNITPTEAFLRKGLPTFHTSQQGKTYVPIDVGGGNFLVRTGELMKMAEPSAPGGAPRQPSTSVEQVQAAVDQAKAKQRRLQFVYDVLEDPEKYNLSIPKLFADGGYVKRADGSPVYGEVADTGPVTADTRAALSLPQGLSASDAFNALRRIYGEGASNLESVFRGSAAVIPGFVGDIGQEFDIPYMRRAPTTKQILKAIPRATTPTKEAEGFEEVGTYLPLPVSPSAVKGSAKAMMAGIKSAGPQIESTLMRMAPGAEPMNIVRPAGGVFPSAKSLAEEKVSKLDKEISDVAEWINLAPSTTPERKAAINFLDTKLRDYFKKQAGSVSDPVREALIEGKIKIPKDSDLEELFPQALIEAARKGDTTAMRLIEQNIDKSSNIKSLKVDTRTPSTGMSTDAQASEEFNQIILEQMKRNPNIIPDSMLLRLSKKNADKLSKDEALKTVTNIRAKLAENPNLFNTVYEEKIMRMLKQDPVKVITEESIQKYPALYSQLENVMNRREGSMAITEGMPITDVGGMPKILGLNIREITEYAEMIPPKELDRMSVPEVVAKVIQLRAGAEGAGKYAERAEKLLSAGKPIPEKISTFGTTPITQPDAKGFVWREITDPAATQIQAKLLGNSIAGYSRPGTYGKLEKGLSALKSGDVRLFSLYDKNNQVVTNVEYITKTATGKPIEDGRVRPNSITQFFGNGPKTGNVAPTDFGPQVVDLVKLLDPVSVPPTITGILKKQGAFFPPVF